MTNQQRDITESLRKAMRDAGVFAVDWLSTTPGVTSIPQQKIDLTEVLGGSGWYHRPKSKRKTKCDCA